jgi:hypothetical protein
MGTLSRYCYEGSSTKSLRSKTSLFTLIRRRDYSLMVEHGLIYLELHAKQKSPPSRGPAVFAIQLVVGGQG